MTWEEKNTWVGALVGIGVLVYYAVAVLTQVSETDVSQINYQPTMLWTIGISIVFTIVGAILVGIVSGGNADTDQRDKDIATRGRQAAYFLFIPGALIAMVLAMTEQPYFWIANTLFLAFAIASITEGVTKIVAYRRGY